jgi:hypothetical protein
VPGMAAGGIAGWEGTAANALGTDAAGILAGDVRTALKAIGAAAAGTLVNYHPAAGVTQWEGLVAQALNMEGLAASLMQNVMIQIQSESGGNPNAINLCMPLDTQILTRRGWLKHDEVRPGDETIGYNAATGRSEWTRVTAVHHYADAPLMRLWNSRWQATTTPEHRWVSLPRITDPAETLPDKCHLCPWPDMPPPPPPPSECPECGWKPLRPGGVPHHRRRMHGVIGANASGNRAERFRRRGTTTAGGLRIHLAKAHGIKGDGQKSTYATDARWVATKDVGSRDRLVLAAPADTGPGLPITVTEAAILGWVAGDGHVEPGGRTAAGNRRGTSMSIAQSKPAQVARLKVLLAGTPHTVYMPKEPPTRTGVERVGPGHLFRFNPAYARDLMARAGHPKRDAFRQVLEMSAEQRRAWLDAFIDAEGYREGEYVSVTQCYGPVLDAAHLAIYLCGYRPRLVDNKVTDPAWNPSAYISACRPVISGAFLHREDAGTGDVWCPTTELGSWTAGGGDAKHQAFLTGNSDSNAAAGDPSRGLLLSGADDHDHVPGVSLAGDQREHLRPAGEYSRRAELRAPRVRPVAHVGRHGHRLRSRVRPGRADQRAGPRVGRQLR